MRIARATAVNRRRSSLKILPEQSTITKMAAAAAPEAAEGVKMPETAFLQEDETDALRLVYLCTLVVGNCSRFSTSSSHSI